MPIYDDGTEWDSLGHYGRPGEQLHILCHITSSLSLESGSRGWKGRICEMSSVHTARVKSPQNRKEKEGDEMNSRDICNIFRCEVSSFFIRPKSGPRALSRFTAGIFPSVPNVPPIAPFYARLSSIEELFLCIPPCDVVNDIWLLTLLLVLANPRIFSIKCQWKVLKRKNALCSPCVTKCFFWF